MAYHVPPVPPGVADDPEAQAAYLLEDGFSTAPEDALVDKLRRREPLRVKFGVDPTAPVVTWGWSVPLRRLRRFQELGHTAVLVIGDFTAQVGDPSGRSATRVRLSTEQVDAYVQSCMASLLEILSPNNLEIRRNSEWLSSLGMSSVLELTAQATVAQLLERDDFSKRFGAHEPISLIEFIYPCCRDRTQWRSRPMWSWAARTSTSTACLRGHCNSARDSSPRCSSPRRR